ncbi:MAG TPA: hypothetical protein VIW26_05500, partial [Gemmatimonadales bacterium]
MRFSSYLASSIGVALAVACHGDSATTPHPTSCGTGVGTSVTLAVGAYTTIDPATSSNCVQFPANASTIDSTEYLVVAQSAAGTSGQSSPFSLSGGAALAAATAIWAAPAPDTRSQTVVAFDGTMRRMARARSYPFVPAALAAAA